MVDPPGVFQIAVFVVTGQVAAAVQPRPRLGSKRVWQEAFGGEGRTVEILLRQTGARANAQLADSASRQQLPGAVEHVQRAARDGSANRNAETIVGIAQAAIVDAGHHRRLGRPVGVEQAHMAQPSLVPQAQAFDRHRFTTDVNLTQRAQAGDVAASTFTRQQEPISRRQVRQGHAIADDLLGQLDDVPEFVTAHDQRRTDTQRRVALFDKTIEAERRKLQHAIISGERRILGTGLAELAQRRVSNRHAFWLAGGTRGVNHVRQVIDRGVIQRIAVRISAQRLDDFAQVQMFKTCRQRHVLQQSGFIEQQIDTAVFDHVGQTLGRVVGIKRYVSGACLQHGQQTDDHLRATTQRQTDAFARCCTAGQQTVSEAIRLTVEFVIAQTLFTALYGQCLRCGFGLRGNALVHQAGVLQLQRWRLAMGEHGVRGSGIEQRQVTEASGDVGDQLLKQVAQVGAEHVHLGGAESRSVVAHLQAQRGAQFDAQRQRIVSAFMVMQVAEGQPGRRALFQRLGDREVFEHQQTVEQRRALMPCPALNVVQRHMLEFTQGQVLRLQITQPLPDALIRARVAHQRQGVDEQPQLLLDARQRRRTTGHCRAERYAVLPGVALQQQAPGRLQQRVEGDFLLTGELAQTPRCGCVDHLAMLVCAVASHGRTHGIGEQCRRLQRRQRSAPERFASVCRLLLQPAHVIAVMPHRRRQ